MNYLKFIPETITDGEGLRASIYLAGCENYCKGCFNPESWSYNSGKELTDEIINNIIVKVKSNPLLEGISVLGGDPFAPKNRKELSALLKKIYDSDIIDIWCWTGYLLEDLKKDPVALEALKYITVLVDGPYIDELRDPTLAYRGSSNQRILHIKGLNYDRPNV